MHSPLTSEINRPKSILVATDLTDLGYLLPVAIEQAKTTGASLWLLHIVPPVSPITAGERNLPGLQKKAISDAESMLARVVSKLGAMDITCAYDVGLWHPVERTVQFIKKHQIDRLIIGTSSRGKLGKLLIGSVAEELIRSVSIPVCTVGPEFKPVAHSDRPRIVYATSLRHNFEIGTHFAAGMAADLSGELIVVHVMEQACADEQVDLRVMTKIDAILKSAQAEGCILKTHIRYGEPAEEILAECAMNQPAWLILGSVAASTLASNFRTGVAYRVIAKSPCPTFTLLNEPRRKHLLHHAEGVAVANGAL